MSSLNVNLSDYNVSTWMTYEEFIHKFGGSPKIGVYQVALKEDIDELYTDVQTCSQKLLINESVQYTGKSIDVAKRAKEFIDGYKNNHKAGYTLKTHGYTSNDFCFRVIGTKNHTNVETTIQRLFKKKYGVNHLVENLGEPKVMSLERHATGAKVKQEVVHIDAIYNMLAKHSLDTHVDAVKKLMDMTNQRVVNEQGV